MKFAVRRDLYFVWNLPIFISAKLFTASRKTERKIRIKSTRFFSLLQLSSSHFMQSFNSVQWLNNKLHGKTAKAHWISISGLVAALHQYLHSFNPVDMHINMAFTAVHHANCTTLGYVNEGECTIQSKFANDVVSRFINSAVYGTVQFMVQNSFWFDRA